MKKYLELPTGLGSDAANSNGNLSIHALETYVQLMALVKECSVEADAKLRIQEQLLAWGPEEMALRSSELAILAEGASVLRQAVLEAGRELIKAGRMEKPEQNRTMAKLAERGRVV